MHGLDRTIAGITCREVLHNLSAYLDGELAAPEVQRIEAHLAQCSECERFGGSIGALVATVRRTLATRDRLPVDVERRLHERLHDALTG